MSPIEIWVPPKEKLALKRNVPPERGSLPKIIFHLYKIFRPLKQSSKKLLSLQYVPPYNNVSPLNLLPPRMNMWFPEKKCFP